MSKRRAVVRKNLEVVNAWMRAQSPNNGPASNDGEEARMATDPSGMSSAECNTPSAIRHHLSLPLESQIKEVFQRVSANFFSGLTFSRMSPEQMEDSLQIEGLGASRGCSVRGEGRDCHPLAYGSLGGAATFAILLCRAAWYPDKTRTHVSPAK